MMMDGLVCVRMLRSNGNWKSDQEQSGGENMLGLKLLYALRVTINLYKHKIIIIHLLKDHVYIPTRFVFKSL